MIFFSFLKFKTFHSYQYPNIFVKQEPNLFSEHEEKVDDVFRLSGEFLSEFRILSGDSDGAGVEVALAHHGAAHHDERHGGKADLVRAEHGGDRDVVSRPHLSVGLKDNSGAEVVHGQHLEF